MRASRLLSILILLQLKGRTSAEDLAREFEVSVRTIYRDIDQLSAAGVPVYAERGRSGGFALLDGYRTKLTGLTQDEAQTLLLGAATGVARDLGLGAEAAAAQLKLLASLSPETSASAQRVGQRFHLDPANWYAHAEPPSVLPALADAVWREKRITVRYESWKGAVTRDLDPLGLVLKAGVWYLVAAWRERPLTYRVSNILSLEITDAAARRPRRFDLAAYWDAWTEDFEARLMRHRALIEVSQEGRKIMRAFLPAAAHAVEASHESAGRAGWVRAEIPVEDVDSAARQLLSLGAELRVLSPAPLRAALAREAKRVVRFYTVSTSH